MKYFLLLVLVSVVFEQIFADETSDADELGKKAMKILEKCTNAHTISPDQIKSIMKLEPVTDQHSKCFLACMAKEMEFMKNDNTFDKRKITTTLKPLVDRLNQDHHEDMAKKIGEIIETCVPLQKGSGDECAAARKAYECIAENGQKLEILPKAP